MELNKNKMSLEKSIGASSSKESLQAILAVLVEIDKSLALAIDLDGSDWRAMERPNRYRNWQINRILIKLNQLHVLFRNFGGAWKPFPYSSNKDNALGLVLRRDYDGKIAKINASINEEGKVGTARLKNAANELEEFKGLARKARSQFNALHVLCDSCQENADIGTAEELFRNGALTLVSALRSLCIAQIFPAVSYEDCGNLAKERTFEEMAKQAERHIR